MPIPFDLFFNFKGTIFYNKCLIDSVWQSGTMLFFEEHCFDGSRILPQMRFSCHLGSLISQKKMHCSEVGSLFASDVWGHYRVQWKLIYLAGKHCSFLTSSIPTNFLGHVRTGEKKKQQYYIQTKHECNRVGSMKQGSKVDDKLFALY